MIGLQLKSGKKKSVGTLIRNTSLNLTLAQVISSVLSLFKTLYPQYCEVLLPKLRLTDLSSHERCSTMQRK
jgi:hypothetical protein